MKDIYEIFTNPKVIVEIHPVRGGKYHYSNLNKPKMETYYFVS